MHLIAHLSSIISVSKELESEINSISKKISFPKGQIILNSSERSDNLYFIEKGLLRGYYFNDGKEITNWFAQEMEFATSFYSFISNKPALENIQALEDCELVQLKNAELQKLYLKFR